ncbi:uncharacterized protein TRIREDRAFT_109779 [Trichoderma reesei QM6a]|uniref:Predicted protein n=2 Tax=Hypocrea jecorina TaxID=51453 RepID=G0RQH0_HYPJQ|nr:uncharacterized protein TRIREDRAFT_109779 [Trichoderma reesei QM6a]EGR46530.1 predicted protein [Trichoderma reesei QM6a]ETS00193.1 hypothetical protein M419DRAFT_84457 [Trichoderma reesei RUT C-30]
MERTTTTTTATTKLAHPILVSKYHPVANYSYPRSEAPSSASSSSSFVFSRTPYSSNEPRAAPISPPPGLVDDRSTYDSEASSSTDDDDFRYHVHSGELWDSFLEAGQHPLHGVYQTETVEMAGSSSSSLSASFEALCVAPPVVPAKDYPALITAAAAPPRIKRRPVPAPPQQTPWPLSDHDQRNHHPSQPRKPSPTYSVFPKMATIPSSGTCTRKSSSSQLSTSSSSTDAPCPPPAQKALPPPPPPPPTCLPPLPPPPQRLAASQYHRSESPRRPRRFSPASSLTSLQRPGTCHGSRPASPMGLPYSLPPTPPPTAPLPALPPHSSRSHHPSTAMASRAHNLSHAEAAAPCHPAPPQTRRSCASSTKLPTRPPPEPLPRSVFEYDTDSDDEDGSRNNNNKYNNNNNSNDSSSSSSSRSSTDSPTLSFFRLYRRSQSPNTSSEGILSRRRGSASKTPLHQAQSQQQQQEQYFVDAAATAAKDRRRRRKRTNTIDSLPPLVAKQADLVLSRMLGRRSR